MKKLLSFFIMFVLISLALSGCRSNGVTSSAGSNFVKPESYTAVIRISINPSFDLYLNSDLKILAVEPKNDDAKQLPLSSVVGMDLSSGISELLSAANDEGFINDNTVATLDFIEGEATIAEIDVIELAKDACDDAIAKGTVNATMDSALMVRLNEEYGCNCSECRSWNKYKYLTSPAEWEYQRDNWKDNYKTDMKCHLDDLDPNSAEYEFMLEQYNKIDEITPTMAMDMLFAQAKANYVNQYEKSPAHEEKKITYEIATENNPIVRPNGEDKRATRELTPEEFFENNPECVGQIEELQECFALQLRVYVNGEQAYNYYGCCAFKVNDKWYVTDGLQYSFG